jgi:hypothetical protein
MYVIASQAIQVRSLQETSARQYAADSILFQKLDTVPMIARVSSVQYGSTVLYCTRVLSHSRTVGYSYSTQEVSMRNMGCQNKVFCTNSNQVSIRIMDCPLVQPRSHDLLYGVKENGVYS